MSETPQKRTKKDIWQNLYEFPLIETEERNELENLIRTEEFKHLFADIQNIEISSSSFQTKHILSHRRIFATFYSVKISVTFFVTESPSFHHQMMEIPIDMMEID